MAVHQPTGFPSLSEQGSVQVQRMSAIWVDTHHPQTGFLRAATEACASACVWGTSGVWFIVPPVHALLGVEDMRHEGCQ